MATKKRTPKKRASLRKARKPKRWGVTVTAPLRLDFQLSEDPEHPGWHVWTDEDLHDGILVPDEEGCKLVIALATRYGGGWEAQAPREWYGDD